MIQVILEARAKIIKKILFVFWMKWEQKNWFWNLLTFRKGLIIKNWAEPEWNLPQKRNDKEKTLATIPILRQQRDWVGGVRKMGIFARVQYYQFWLMPYPCSYFYFDIKFGDRLYSKEKRRASISYW